MASVDEHDTEQDESIAMCATATALSNTATRLTTALGGEDA